MTPRHGCAMEMFWNVTFSLNVPHAFTHVSCTFRANWTELSNVNARITLNSWKLRAELDIIIHYEVSGEIMI